MEAPTFSAPPVADDPTAAAPSLFDDSLQTNGLVYLALVFGINLLDLMAIMLLTMIWKYKNRPGIAFRQPALLALLVLYFVFYDLWVTGDALNYLQTGGTPCAFWEWADDMDYMLYVEVLIVRGLVLFMTFNRTLLLKEHHAAHHQRKLSEYQAAGGGRAQPHMSMTADFDSKEVELTLTPAKIEKIRKYQKWTKPRFVITVVAILMLVQSIPFFVDWMIHPDKLTTSFEDTPGDCYRSFAYELVLGTTFVLGGVAVYVAYKLRLVQDNFHIRFELINLGVSWSIYSLINWSLGYMRDQDLSNILQTALYLLFLAYFYLCFLMFPLWKFALSDVMEKHPFSTAEAVIDERELFVNLVRDELFFEAFLDFVNGEYCSENLFFIRDAQDFVATFDSKLSNNLEKATAIYEQYLKVGALTELNVGYVELTRMRNLGWETGTVLVERDMFDQVMKEVVDMLAFGPYKRYQARHPGGFKTHSTRVLSRINQSIALVRVHSLSSDEPRGSTQRPSSPTHGDDEGSKSKSKI